MDLQHVFAKLVDAQNCLADAEIDWYRGDDLSRRIAEIEGHRAREVIAAIRSCLVDVDHEAFVAELKQLKLASADLVNQHRDAKHGRDVYAAQLLAVESKIIEIETAMMFLGR